MDIGKSLVSTHHGLVGVLLELDQANPGDIFQVHVSVGAVWGVSVQVRRSGRGSHPQRLVAVDLVSHHVVSLEQSLGINRHSVERRFMAPLCGQFPPVLMGTQMRE